MTGQLRTWNSELRTVEALRAAFLKKKQMTRLVFLGSEFAVLSSKLTELFGA